MAQDTSGATPGGADGGGPAAATAQDVARYRANLQSEREGAALYQVLAHREKDQRLAEVYRRLAETEQRHASVWEERLRAAGQPAQPFRPSWRTSALGWLARRLGAAAVVPIVSSMERQASSEYDNQPEARAAGMPADERSHARLFRSLQTMASGGGVVGPMLAQIEGRHRNTGGGNALRAAVLGSSDGLTSNLSLVMGVAGASVSSHAVLLTGFAGLLAGALSMAIGELLSVQSARELYGKQIETERQELATVPEEEREELSLIYQAKGLDVAAADRLAERIIGEKDTALDTLAREELGIDPEQLGGSAWEAAIASFLLFALGAVIPVVPFIFASGGVAIISCIGISIIGFLLIGAGVSLTTGVSLLRSGPRQILMGLIAAGITFGLGRLVGGHLG
jgi:VIT1/CCC1 family predicted Fe2+/Mn2+ transporter/rubrerythrin